MKLFEKLMTYLGFVPRRVVSDIYSQISDELRARSEFYRLLMDRGAGLVRALLQTVIQSKRDLVDLVEAYKDTFFHVAIVEMLVDDVLSVDPISNEVVQLSSQNEVVDKILEDLQERVDLDSFIQSVVADVISYGDYVVMVKHDGKGVVELLDCVDQRDVLVVYRAGFPIFYIQLDKYRSDLKVEEYIDFIHFCVPGRRVRISVDKMWKEVLGLDQIGDYFRLGKPLFWGCWDLLSSLYILLIFYPVFAVQKLNASTIVGIRIPKEVPPHRAQEIAREYQQLMNVNIGVDRLGRVSVADVLDTIGRYKVIPVYAEDEKGLLQLNDPRLQEEYGLEIVEELKRVICATVGVPYQLLFGSVEGAGRLEVLKAFNRYVKKVASIQNALKLGLIQLALIECRLKGLKVSPAEIEVRFRNNIISVEHLDRLEFLAGVVETIRSSVETITGIKDAIGSGLDIEKLVEFVNRYFGLVGLDGVFKIEDREQEVRAGGEFEVEEVPIEGEGEEGLEAVFEEESGVEEFPLSGLVGESEERLVKLF
ncbi:MAG: hypothetical protein QXT86_12795 [Archaeoglobaceae archaeon]